MTLTPQGFLPLPPTPLGPRHELCPDQDSRQPVCFHPHFLPVPNSQVMTQGQEVAKLGMEPLWERGHGTEGL